MYDLPSFSPAYPHARYSHSTALLTDNHLLLFGGCLRYYIIEEIFYCLSSVEHQIIHSLFFSGYGKGGPCPSTDTWLLTIDRGNWERLGECPTTKLGANMVTIPSYSMCAGVGQNAADASASMSFGTESPIAVLWSGREQNPSSILVSHLY
jgi:hypothetical protein